MKSDSLEKKVAEIQAKIFMNDLKKMGYNLKRIERLFKEIGYNLRKGGDIDVYVYSLIFNLCLCCCWACVFSAVGN